MNIPLRPRKPALELPALYRRRKAVLAVIRALEEYERARSWRTPGSLAQASRVV
jgi:hypothetical protein